MLRTMESGQFSVEKLTTLTDRHTFDVFTVYNKKNRTSFVRAFENFRIESGKRRDANFRIVRF